MTELYDDALLDLARQERRLPADPTGTHTLRSRLCADRVTAAVRVVDGRIEAAGWSGEACAICRAGATLACDAVVGASEEELDALRGELDAALSGVAEGPFAALAAVAGTPSRAACARLPWRAIESAVQERPEAGSEAPAATAEASPRAAMTPTPGLARDPWAAALAMRAAGLDVALATLVDVVGSSPCPLGSVMVVGSDGRFWGAVSGGCVESAVVQAGLAVIGGAPAGLHAFQIANSQAGEVGLPCGGRVTIHVGPAPGDPQLRRYRAVGRGLARVLDLQTGREALEPSAATRPKNRGDAFVQPLTAPLRLVLVGGTRIAQVLAELAAPLGYEVLVVEPRPGFAGPDRFGVSVVDGLPEQVLPDLIDARTAVVTLTHDARLDDPALVAALASDAFYVGALGSRKTQRARLDRLRAAGVPAEQLARLHGPAGLAIGAVGAEEIALSILGQVVATRRQRRQGVGAVVLAAGRSVRAGRANKLLQPIDGEPMIRRAVQTVLAAGASPCLVVLGHQAEAVQAALADLPVQFVANPAYAEGMGTSVAAGVEAMAAHPVEASLVVLGDMPWLEAATLRRLMDGFVPATADLVHVPVAGRGDGRRRGNPVLWPRRCFDDLRALRGDVGGKAILARAPGIVLEVPVDDEGVLADVDGILTAVG